MKQLFCFLFLIITTSAVSQNQQFQNLINNIKAENLRKYADTLASPYMEGRGYGTHYRNCFYYSLGAFRDEEEINK